MSRVLFTDRDGTLIEEPEDERVDALAKLRFMPGVFAALAALSRAGYRLIMVTNQDGLGGPDFPHAAFDPPHRFLLEALRSQGIVFDAVFICPHTAADGCACRKPKTGLLQEYVREHSIDRAGSAVVGDRASDLELAANLGVRGFTVRRDGSPDETWDAIARGLLAPGPPRGLL
jgi:imidazoleglycerol-phosphate dehydratase / histidinol-phosphatase